MKISASSLCLFVAFGNGVAFPLQEYATGRSYSLESLHLLRPQSQPTSSRLWTSMSTMNILEEGKEEVPSLVTVSTVSHDEVDWDWQAVATSVFSEEEQRPIVLFDGICNLCDASVNFFMDHDSEAKLRFCSLHSKVAQSLLIQAGKKPTYRNKIVLVTKEKTYYSSEAVSRICQHLDPAPLRFIGKVGRYTPTFLRESIYKVVSANRHRFGQNDSCRLDFDGTFTSRFVSDPVDIAEV